MNLVFELGHKAFEGNLNDSRSLIRLIDSLQEICKAKDSFFPSVKPLIIMDAGVATR